jgi:plasmid stabilization system protein ParE
VKVSLAPEAEQDLVEGALFYAREANAELGQAFISEFERSAAVLGEQPRLGAVWTLSNRSALASPSITLLRGQCRGRLCHR